MSSLPVLEQFFPPQTALEFVQKFPGLFDNILYAGEWNLLGHGLKEKSAVALLEECEKQNIEVQIAGVFASGCLVGGETFNYQKMSDEVRGKLEGWQALARDFRVSLPALALHFSFQPRCVGKLVLGMRSELELEKNVDSLNSLAEGLVDFKALYRKAAEQGLIAATVYERFYK